MQDGNFKWIFAIIEGGIYASIGVVVATLLLPSGSLTGRVDPDFASRWMGNCTGWTKELTLWHLAGDLMQWYAYVVIAIVYARLHPILADIPSSRITVPLVVLIFTFCGGTHLYDAYTYFHPAYVGEAWYKTVAGIIGLTGCVFVAHNLYTAFGVVQRKNERLEKLELEELERGRKV